MGGRGQGAGGRGQTKGKQVATGFLIRAKPPGKYAKFTAKYIYIYSSIIMGYPVSLTEIKYDIVIICVNFSFKMYK